MGFDVKAVLAEAGWYEGRKIDVNGLELYLNQWGYEMFPKVREFLEEYGELSIVLPRPIGIGRKEDRTHTYVKKAIADCYKNGSFNAEEKYARERLVPVGETSNEYLIIFVSESGKFYHNTGKIGDNAEEAWSHIINKTTFKPWGTF